MHMVMCVCTCVRVCLCVCSVHQGEQQRELCGVVMGSCQIDLKYSRAYIRYEEHKPGQA